MATADPSQTLNAGSEALRDEWLGRLTELVNLVENCGQELDWSTRRIEKKMHDSLLGTYQAPALLLQKETCRVLLDPIARSAPGVDGVVDLYLMPAYDDIANLYFSDGAWRIHYTFAGASSAGTPLAYDLQPLSKEALSSVLEEMRANAA
jgi:hypothetical protein